MSDRPATPPDPKEEIDSLRAAVARQPGHSGLQARLGHLLHRIGDPDGARRHFSMAVAIDPTLHHVQFDLGNILLREGNLIGALACFGMHQNFHPQDWMRIRMAAAIPTMINTGDDITILRARADHSLQSLQKAKLRMTEAPPRDGVPLFFLAYYNVADRPLYEKLAQLYRQAWPALSFTAPHCVKPKRPNANARIKVGFVSAFLHNHSVGKLFRGLIEKLDRTRFDVTVAMVPNMTDPMSKEIAASADRAINLPLELTAAQRALAAEKLDIIVYPEIGMDNATYFLAQARLAPVQCVSWGHPVTTGLPTMDYFISSELLEPEDGDDHYSETLVRLKTLPSYLYRPAIGEHMKTRADFGLSPDLRYYFVGQYLFKLHPEFDKIMAAILRGDPQGIILIVRGKHPAWERFISARFARNFPNEAKRIQFIDTQPHRDFLALVACVDVCLDIPSFNGGNTTLEALAMGTPIVTMASAMMRGRVCAAMYRQIGVTDAIATSAEQYVELALRMTRDMAFRITLRGEIQRNRHQLFGDGNVIGEWERFFLAAIDKASLAERRPA